VGSFRIDPEEAPTVVGALEAGEKVRSAERTAVDDPETERADDPVGARRVDAFVAIMENALAGELGERSGGDRYLTTVHVDAETLADDADGRCHRRGRLGPLRPSRRTPRRSVAQDGHRSR